MRKLSVIILGLVIVVLGGCTTNTTVESEKISVAATFYPLGEIAREVGGDLVGVVTITPAGAEPHDYEPTPQDIIAIYNARLFLTNGVGVDAWADKMNHIAGTKMVMSDALQMPDATDPHFWLDPVLFAREVDAVRDTLMTIDPSHADIYTANAAAYTAKLTTLDAAFKTGLTNCTQDSIITSHEAFGYLAQRYGFTMLSIAGFSPDQEPSPTSLGDLSNLAKEKGITVVFFESLVSSRLADTIASEIGATVMILNPLEGLTEEEMAAGANYISVMEQNLINLRTALSCS